MLEVVDTKELEFLEYVKMEVDIAKEAGHLSNYGIYEMLKKQIQNFEVDYETGIKIIVEVLEL